MLTSGLKRKAAAIADDVAEEENQNNNENTTKEEQELLVTEHASSESDDTPTPQYLQGEKVLARDNDGLLYIAFVRRALYGIPQQHKLDLIGTLDGGNGINGNNNNNNNNKDDDDTSPRWYYFVHYLAWKVNWDRWVAEQDLLPVTDKYLKWQQTIQTEHRKLLQQCKQGKRGVDGAAFLKAWKPKLESLLQSFQGTTKKQSTKVMVKKKQTTTTPLQQEETRKHQLTSRTPAEISLLHVPSGLKRVLVEDWEILNGEFGMVHQLQPETSLRRILDLYLESKGVKQIEEAVVATEETAPTAESVVVPMDPKSSVDESLPASNPTEPKESDEHPAPLDDTQRRHKEWTDMANGLCQLLDQALPFRLLYPTEQSQLYTLLEHGNDDEKIVSLSSHYGCVHFLRLCCQLPQLLQEQYNDDELQQHLVKPLLAKVNDFLRFLQEHHHHAFPQRFRKKSVEEEKLEQKWIKKYERQRVVGEGEEQ